ncbi:MAG: bifunctional DNA-formamidopyrimidine glycosylase/DNA-(apurinic or apyrimidinic site) lyase [Planctomycetes bacterium]|nr:bifunctional DNA-formamidopyrimidine glycosylase/DNA-(apurinic or apyrimidinic site) lyase [Planctomycetota bacterium]
MPELPEVETMRRGILGAVGGTIVSLESCRCRRRPITIQPELSVIRRRIQGALVTDVRRVGKRVVLCTSAGFVVVEPRMSGLVTIAEPPTREHLRLRITLQNCALREILFWDRRGLGVVRLMSAAQLDELSRTRLGPDALEISPDELRHRLAGSRRPIKVALLDQARLAGVGNLYASEILHRARIDPRQECQRLTAPQWLLLHGAMRKVLQEAIRHEGSTLADGTYRNTLSQLGSYQAQHAVYDRAGETCNRCRRGTIVRIVQAQRSTFYCPTCQPAAIGKGNANRR